MAIYSFFSIIKKHLKMFNPIIQIEVIQPFYRYTDNNARHIC